MPNQKQHPELILLKDWLAYYKLHGRGEAPDEESVALVNRKSRHMAAEALDAIAAAGNTKNHGGTGKTFTTYHEALKRFKTVAQHFCSLRDSISEQVLSLRESYVKEHGGVDSLRRIIETSALDEFIHDDASWNGDSDVLFSPFYASIIRAKGPKWDDDDNSILDEVLHYEINFGEIQPGNWNVATAALILRLLFLEERIDSLTW